MSRRSLWIGIAWAAVSLSGVLAAAETPALNVRLGLWEITSTTSVGG